MFLTKMQFSFHFAGPTRNKKVSYAINQVLELIAAQPGFVIDFVPYTVINPSRIAVVEINRTAFAGDGLIGVRGHIVFK